MAQSYDPDVIAFLKTRNAPLTHANYNSVLQQMESNPQMRPSKSGEVTDPSEAAKSYDGGLDELNLGDDAKSSSKSGGGGKQAIPALKGAGAVEPGNKSQPNIKDDAQAENTRDKQDTPHQPTSGGTQLAQGGAWDKILGPLAGAAAGGGAAAGVYSLLNRDGGTPPSPGAAGVEPPDLMRGVDATAAPVGGPSAGGELDMLAGHAPPAALPPPGQPQIGGPPVAPPTIASPQSPPPQQVPPQIAAPTGTPTEGMVLPGAAPSSPVVPMPDNAGSGMLESLMQRLKSVPPEHLAQLVQALKAAGHIR